mgnify:CR=1 FL=1
MVEVISQNQKDVFESKMKALDTAEGIEHIEVRDIDFLRKTEWARKKVEDLYIEKVLGVKD